MACCNLSPHSFVFCREQSSNNSYSQSVYVRNYLGRLALSYATQCSRGDLAIIGKPGIAPFFDSTQRQNVPFQAFQLMKVGTFHPLHSFTDHAL